MSLVKKLKDILFEEEEYTEPIKVKEEKKEEDKIVKIEPIKEDVVDNIPKRVESHEEMTSERDLFKSDNTFKFPDFDEEEFASSMSRVKQNTNVLDYERKKNNNKTRDINRYERDNKNQREVKENKEYVDKKKFKPSPIISPVYGILNQDYKADEIVKKDSLASNIDIEYVRRKAFGSKEEEKIEKKVVEEINKEEDPVVTFFEEKDEIVDEKKDNYKTIDDLLEEASEEITLEDTLEIPKTNNLDVIEEELEKIEEENKEKQKALESTLDETDSLDDTLDSDLFELIDSMYDEREEG